MILATSLNVFDTGIPKDIAFKRLRDAGFNTLDFNYNDHSWDMIKEGWSWDKEEKWAHHMKELANEHGMTFLQSHAPIHGNVYTQMVRGLDYETFVEIGKRALRSSQIVGAKWMVFHPMVTPSKGFDRSHRVDQLKLNRDFFNDLLPVIEETGVGVAFENMADGGGLFQKHGIRRYFGAIPEELIDLVDYIDHPLVGICWDTGHAHVQGLDQESGLRSIGKRLKVTHIQDNDGIKDQHLLPYHGSVDWNTVIRTLREIEYQGAFAYEVHHAITDLPDELRDAGLAYAHRVGEYLLNLEG